MPPAAHLPLLWADAVHDPDAALLRRFAADRDPAAFAVLVRRYGPLVFGVCLRTAGQRQDAEDAFQAVFLILAQKVSRITRPELLGNWLYGVAVRVARKAKRAAHRRHTREVAMTNVPRPSPPPAGWSDAAPVIDEELSKLAEHYRTAILLCDVQGLSRTDAAARLGIPEGTLSSRLNQGRKKLAERLTRRGVTLTATVVGTLLTEHATAAVTDELTGRLSMFLQHLSAGDPISGSVGELLREGWAMRPKLWAGLAVLGLGAAGVTFAAWPGGAGPQADPPKAAKAEEPKEENKDGDKPAKATKPKLIDTIQEDMPLNAPFWSDDGRILFVARYATPAGWSQRTPPKTFTMFGYEKHPKNGGEGDLRRHEFECPSGGFLGLYDGDKAYAYYSAAGRRINAPDLLVFTQLVRRDPENKRVASRVEIDLEDGRPYAVSPDGKQVFAEKVKITPTGPQAVTINALDAKTGEVARTIGTFGNEETLVRAHKLSPAADRLFVYLQGADFVIVECYDVANGKRLWDARLAGTIGPEPREGSPSTLAPGLLVPSGGGNRLAVLVSKDKAQEAMEIRVFDATTGKSLVELQGQRDGRNVGLGFSHDGRMLVGKTAGVRQRTSLVVPQINPSRGRINWWCGI